LFKQFKCLNSIESRVLIDLEAIVSFITLREVKRYRIKTQKKKRLYKLIIINRLAISLEEVNRETKPIKMLLGIYKEMIILDIIEITRNKVVLGKD
jgi:hypothetical protein